LVVDQHEYYILLTVMSMTLPLTEKISSISSSDPYTYLVRQVFRVDDVTWGGDRENFVVRYRGQLYGDSAEAYDRLATSLKPLDVTPLFRKEEGQHAIILVRGVIRPTPSKTWVNLLLFAFTVLSVIFAGAFFNYDGPFTSNLAQIRPYLLPALGRGMAFAVSLLAILLAHEFGHYLAGRYHHTAVTLPYFIPFPISPFGTMGAFIQLKEPPKNRRILLDIGVAGPLAGMVIAIPILFLGLHLSQVDRLPMILRQGEGFSMEGNSILYLAAKYLVFGQLLPSPATFNGMNPVLYWIRYFFTGMPAPLGGADVMLHPIAFAGWAGLLVTALNLIPVGQLDGGHLLYVLLGSRARNLLPFILIATIALGVVWQGWWLWAFLIFLLGRVYAEPLDQITPLDPNRRLLAIAGLVIFVLVFTPIPLSMLVG
jgi:membrane-associated protease RseP (regulator of RpoE activity)